MRNMFKITIFAAFAAVAGMSSILSGFGSAAMATPSLCDSIAGNLVAIAASKPATSPVGPRVALGSCR